MPAMQQIILHIDFDSFFASVEQQHHPPFRNKPLGVTATNGRTCIIASSREAKRLGIGTGSRTFDAQKICPDIILTPANFTEYWEISKKFISICKDFSPFVEVFSIDELFLDITMTAHLFGGTHSLITKLKQRIATEVGEYVTVSVGVSHNKMLAKMASGLKKPNGVFTITPSHIEAVYRIAKLQDICGIGPRIERRLNAMGIYTLMQLRRTPLSSLIAEFGNVEGTFLKNVGLGVDPGMVKPFTQAPSVKSVSRNYCLPHNEYDARKVMQNVYELSEEVALKLRRLHKRARKIGIYLGGSSTVSAAKTFSDYFNTGAQVFNICLAMLQLNPKHEIRNPKQTTMTKIQNAKSFEGFEYSDLDISSNFDIRFSDLGLDYVRQISVWATSLESDTHITQSLFDIGGRSSRLTATIDKLNDRFGDHTIRNGFLLYADKLTTVPNGYGSDVYERTKLADQMSE